MPNKLTSTKAVQDMLDNGYTPLEDYQGTDHRWLCLHHSCGNEVRVRHHVVTSKGRPNTKCIICKQTAVADILELLESKNMQLVDPKQLESPTGYVKIRGLFLDCVHLDCGNQVNLRVNNLKEKRHQGSGCVHCGPKLSGMAQRLPYEKLLEMASNAGVTLLGEPPRTHSRKWRLTFQCHRCSRVGTTTYQTLRRGGGCKTCNFKKRLLDPNVEWKRVAGGFNKRKNSTIYLLTDRKGNLKVGISNTSAVEKRLQLHGYNGWHVAYRWDNLRGATAYHAETEVLRWWRGTLMAPFSVSKKDMPQGGWTETASTRKVGLRRTADRIDELVKIKK